MPDFDPVQLQALLDKLKPSPTTLDYPAPQLPQGPNPDVIRQTLERARNLDMLHGAFGVRIPSTYEVMRSGSAAPTLPPSPSYDAARANILAPAQAEQARVDLANQQAGVQNKYAQEKATLGIKAHAQENATALAEMKGLLTAYMLNPKLQNAQDVANINASGRVKAAKVGADARLNGPPISDDALAQAADIYTKTGQVPAVGNAGTRAKVATTAAKRSPTADITTNKAQNTANKASLTKLQTMSDTTDAFEATALKNLDQFILAAQKVTDTGSPALNKPARWLDENMGDPNVAAFRTARQVAVTEIAKVLSSSNANLTDSARHEVAGLIGPNATGAQIAEAAKILKTDMENRRASNKAQIQTVTGRISGQPGGDKTIVKYQRNAKTGQRRPVYSDGTYGEPE